MKDLIAFLKAQLDKDEGRATAALEEWDDESARHEWEDLPDATFVHARWHDPARTLREVAAARQVIAEYEGSTAITGDDDQYAAGVWIGLQALAAAYSDDGA